MSQSELARVLRDAGHPFHQQTVQRVEIGDRPVRLQEAFAIADALGSTPEQMVRSVRENTAEQAIREAHEAHGNLLEAMERYQWTRETLAVEMSALPKHETRNGHIAGAESWLRVAVEDVAREWRMNRTAAQIRDDALYGDLGVAVDDDRWAQMLLDSDRPHDINEAELRHLQASDGKHQATS